MASPCPHQEGSRAVVLQGSALLHFGAQNSTLGTRNLAFPVIMLKQNLMRQDWEQDTCSSLSFSARLPFIVGEQVPQNL